MSTTQTDPGTTPARGSGFRIRDTSTYRVAPSAIAALAVVVVAVAVNLAVSQLNGVQYTEIAESVGNLLRGVMTSTGSMLIVLLLAVTWLGWWRPVWRQRPKATSRWIWLAPAAMLASLSLTFAAALGTPRTVAYMLTLLLVAALVGLGEELAFRGIVVVGLRQRFGEGWVWFLSSLLFGLAHAGNALSGQDLSTTAMQVIATFFLGTVLYVARMVSGSLLVPVVLHALWDVAALSSSTATQTVAGLSLTGNAFQWLAILLALVAIWPIVKQGRALRRSDQPEPVVR